jgi:hypothetical protein
MPKREKNPGVDEVIYCPQKMRIRRDSRIAQLLQLLTDLFMSHICKGKRGNSGSKGIPFLQAFGKPMSNREGFSTPWTCQEDKFSRLFYGFMLLL